MPPPEAEVGAVIVGIVLVPKTTLCALKLKPDKATVAAVTVRAAVVLL